MLVIGIVCLFGCGTAREVRSGDPPLPVPQRPAAQVPASPEARRVGRLFLETAVARKNLATAYAITGPWLKGIPRRQWLTGRNPVTYYPAPNLKTAPFRTLSSTKSSVLLEVRLKGLKAAIGPPKSLAFKLEVDRIGGKWLVNYFMPDYVLYHGP